MKHVVKVWMLLAVIITVSGAAEAQDTLSVTLAKGVQFSDGGAVFFRYRSDRLEYHLGGWDGDNSNVVVGVGYPLAYQGKLDLRWLPGFAAVNKKTDILGTHWQFYNHFEVAYDFGPRLAGHVAWIHYSNGSRVFHHGYEPNLGENFIDLWLTYSWKKRWSTSRALPPPGYDLAMDNN